MVLRLGSMSVMSPGRQGRSQVTQVEIYRKEIWRMQLICLCVILASCSVITWFVVRL